MTRSFARQTPKQASHSLASRLTAERLPLDLALSLSVEVVSAIASAHQQRRAFGNLCAADLVVQPDGSLAVLAPSVAGADSATDTFAVGAVLYQLFTGLTPNQARAQLKVSALHDVPPASRLNPAIDDTLDELLSLMLARDPARRPQSLRVVEALLVDVCESVDLEPSRAAILRWASIAPSLRVVAAVRHTPTFVILKAEDVVALEEDESEDEESTTTASVGPLRFDVWAAAACAFSVVAFAMATHL